MKKKTPAEIEIKLIDFVRSIIKRPALFEVNKIEDLYFILLGYLSALNGEEKNKVFTFLSEFKYFVNKYFKFKEDSTWQRLIRFYSGSDNNSLSLFNKLFEEFINKIYKK